MRAARRLADHIRQALRALPNRPAAPGLAPRGVLDSRRGAIYPGDIPTMRVLLQRVSQASVTVDGEVVGRIARGFCLLVGFTHTDSSGEVAWMAEKVAGLRLFPDDAGRMNLDLRDVGGALLVVSQFTLYGECSKGRRPSFNDASRPEHATPLYEAFCARLSEKGFEVATGRFGAEMDVRIHNDGPVTLWLER